MQKTVEYIIEHGKRYEPATLPEGVERGVDGRCFDNAIIAAMKHGFKVVQGIASDPGHPDRWIVHSWVTDGVHAFDLSWYAEDQDGKVQPVPATYIGFEINLKDLCIFAKATEYTSVLYNMNENLELARKCIPGLPGEELPQAFEILSE